MEAVEEDQGREAGVVKKPDPYDLCWEREIEIRLKGVGAVSIMAQTYGGLAVHKAPGEAYFVITHIDRKSVV